VTALERPISTHTSKLQTRPLVREGAPQEKPANVSKYFSWKSKEDWSRVTNGDLLPGEAGRLTVGRKITLT
jgi:hypothetical protein